MERTRADPALAQSCLEDLLNDRPRTQPVLAVIVMIKPRKWQRHNKYVAKMNAVQEGIS